MYKTCLIVVTALALTTGGAFAQSPTGSDQKTQAATPGPAAPSGHASANADDDHLGTPEQNRAANSTKALTPADDVASTGGAAQTAR